MPSTPTSVRYSHAGVCVTDLERSLRFYCDGLGYEHVATYDIGDAFGNALEVAGDVALKSVFLQRDGAAIELLVYDSPAVTGAPSAHRNQLGLTHLSFYVGDVDAMVEHLVACGGTVLESTRTKVEGPGGAGTYLVFLADPDGIRVEIMQEP